MPDELVVEGFRNFTGVDPVLGTLVCILLFALWWIDRRAGNERKTFQEALDARAEAHLADVKKANEQFGPIKDQMAALVISHNALADIMRERRK